jgi:hypothetical protein
MAMKASAIGISAVFLRLLPWFVSFAVLAA